MSALRAGSVRHCNGHGGEPRILGALVRAIALWRYSSMVVPKALEAGRKNAMCARTWSACRSASSFAALFSALRARSGSLVDQLELCGAASPSNG
ncbi:hypothetical protein [Stutzerimonas sp. NM35]